jgi:FlaA1/EpsC-like NDP-sugar epimerase/DNA-binding NarL/FixJ family response regulator
VAARSGEAAGSQRNMTSQFKNRNLYVMVALDALAFSAALLLAYATRFSFALNDRVWRDVVSILPWVVAVKALTFLLLGAYQGLWRYTSMHDAWRLLRASALASLIIIAGLTFVNRFHGYPRSVFVADSIFTCFLCGGIRMAIRLHYRSRRHAAHHRDSDMPPHRAKLVIVGAGDAADKIVREVQDDAASRFGIACCIDDDHAKWGGTLHGIPILGPIDRLPELVTRYGGAEVLIAIPSLSGARVLRIVDLCRQNGVPCRTLPALSSIIDGRVSVKNFRDVAVEDLLGRPPVKSDDTAVQASLQDACVMVTGAGGSIGSEIARQIARHNPRCLILFEIGESPLFEIHRELHDRHPGLDIIPVIGDIRQVEVVNRAFDMYRPQMVYHAAAYKHVPLMEAHADEAVLNNVRGTRHVAEAARRVKTRRFVTISSDKAVRPTNIMGATKRLCELLVQAMNGDATEFVAVRFGNVLGSNGSVIPIFQKQIAARGPITVTDPEMTRFFMTIPEAVHLVLRCGAMQDRQGVYVLEMGTPVRIMDLARNMIRLSGLREGRDIAITITGLRPGEKLHEELVTYGEGLQKTAVDKVNILEQTALPIAPTVFLAIARHLEQVASSHDIVQTRTILMQIIALDQDVHEHHGHGASDAVLQDIQRRWTNAATLGAGTGEGRLRGKRLLLVDDERFMRNTLGPALSRLGCQVDLAETKQQAMERLAANAEDYDLILCDLYLPDGTGMEILADHRKRSSGKPFILMTAYDSPQLDDILGSGTEPPLLFKPFRIEDLMTIVESETGEVANACAPAGQGGLLPSARPSLEASPGPPAMEVVGQAAPRAGDTLRVLIVDDSAVIRERLVALLNDIDGVEVVGQAETAAQAAGALRHLKPDAMTMDLRLPDGNGMDLLRLIQREHLSTAVIVLTSYPYPQYDQRARAAGAYAFLNKAADFDKITHHVQALIAGKR